jgi:phosphoserine phosphatase RsbU/P
VQETAYDRVCEQIALLQESTPHVVRTLTLEDLSAQFVRIAMQAFPYADVHVFVRSVGAGHWLALPAGRDHESDNLVESIPEDGTGECRVHMLPSGLGIARRLADGADCRLFFVQSTRTPGEESVDQASARLLAFFFDSAYRELLTRKRGKDLVFSLNHRVLQLNSLIDTGIEVGKLEHQGSVTRLALERAVSLTNASAGRVRVMEGESIKEDILFPGGVLLDADSSMRSHIETDVEFGGRVYLFELFNKESREGIVQFEPTDHLLLDALARQVHASLENSHLHQQALEKQRMEQDLTVAASIQERLLPATLPGISGYDIAGINVPSKSVGGDYYDCIPLAGGKYALVMADVAGKGIPAALLVSSLHAYLHAYLETGMPLVDLVRRLNQVIFSASTDDKFITAFIGILTPSTGILESVNAGHNPVYCVRADGTVGELNAGGIALGMLDMDFPYQSEVTVMGEGDALLLYTDGIPEAADRNFRLYESHMPLKAFLQQHHSKDARGLVATLIGDIRNFTENAPQNDDITVLYLIRQYLPPPPSRAM